MYLYVHGYNLTYTYYWSRMVTDPFTFLESSLLVVVSLIVRCVFAAHKHILHTIVSCATLLPQQ